eukprot:Rmarinus@m.29632
MGCGSSKSASECPQPVTENHSESPAQNEPSPAPPSEEKPVLPPIAPSLFVPAISLASCLSAEDDTGAVGDSVSVVSADGGVMVALPVDNKVVFLRLHGGDIKKNLLEGHTGEVAHVCFSKDGSLLASSSRDKSIRIWDTNTCEQKSLLRGHALSVRGTCFTEDNRFLVSGGDDKLVMVWNVETSECEATLMGHSSFVNCVAASSAGNYIVSASDQPANVVQSYRTSNVSSQQGSTLILWDLEKKEQKCQLWAHDKHVRSVTMSAKGDCFVSTSFDRSMRVWDTSTLPPKSMAFEEGQNLCHASLSGDGLLVLYRIRPEPTAGKGSDEGVVVVTPRQTAVEDAYWASAGATENKESTSSPQDETNPGEPDGETNSDYKENTGATADAESNSDNKDDTGAAADADAAVAGTNSDSKDDMGATATSDDATVAETNSGDAGKEADADADKPIEIAEGEGVLDVENSTVATNNPDSTTNSNDSTGDAEPHIAPVDPEPSIAPTGGADENDGSGADAGTGGADDEAGVELKTPGLYLAEVVRESDVTELKQRAMVKVDAVEINSFDLSPCGRFAVAVGSGSVHVFQLSQA